MSENFFTDRLPSGRPVLVYAPKGSQEPIAIPPHHVAELVGFLQDCGVIWAGAPAADPPFRQVNVNPVTGRVE